MATVVRHTPGGNALILTAVVSPVHERTAFTGLLIQHPGTHGFAVSGGCYSSPSSREPKADCPNHHRNSS